MKHSGLRTIVPVCMLLVAATALSACAPSGTGEAEPRGLVAVGNFGGWLPSDPIRSSVFAGTRSVVVAVASGPAVDVPGSQSLGVSYTVPVDVIETVYTNEPMGLADPPSWPPGPELKLRIWDQQRIKPLDAAQLVSPGDRLLVFLSDGHQSGGEVHHTPDNTFHITNDDGGQELNEVRNLLKERSRLDQQLVASLDMADFEGDNLAPLVDVYLAYSKNTDRLVRIAGLPSSPQLPDDEQRHIIEEHLQQSR